MSEEQTTAVEPSILDKIASMQAEIDRLKTNPENRPMTIMCNVCGKVLTDGKRCPLHPTEKVNHVRDDGVLAKQV